MILHGNGEYRWDCDLCGATTKSPDDSHLPDDWYSLVVFEGDPHRESSKEEWHFCTEAHLREWLRQYPTDSQMDEYLHGFKDF